MTAVGITAIGTHFYYTKVITQEVGLKSLFGSAQFLTATSLCATAFHCLPLGKLLRDYIDEKELHAPYAAFAPLAFVLSACLFYRSAPHLKSAKRIAQFMILNFGATSFFFSPFITPLRNQIKNFVLGRAQQNKMSINKIGLGILGMAVIFSPLLKPYKLRTPHSPASFQQRIFYLVTVIPFYYFSGKTLEFYLPLRNS
ncbi:MAG: hypothetical protein SNF33_05420 [Candidatus Algichlamydia australiensis]|nr:hypothetical protein [Chlamydiales bacterium]